jgi:predicted nuclease of restriction endonuclease-like (RecB) superfamily
MDAAWGSGFFEQLSKDLMREFPEMKGFSTSNLYYIKQFYLFYSQSIPNFQQVAGEIRYQVGSELEMSNFQQAVGELQSDNNKDVTIRRQVVGELEVSSFQQAAGELRDADNMRDTIRQQLVGELQSTDNMRDTIRPQVVDEFQVSENKELTIRHQVGDELETHPIFQIPWGHHVQIFTKCKSVKEALFYVQKTIQNSWSRAVLMNFMEIDLYSTQGKARTNFSKLLPKPQSDLANELLKDPYNFDFITLTEPYREKELEDALTTHITKFLLELGQGFAYVGRQVPVKIGQKERFIDLLFYHLDLRCYVVIELKAGEFEAEHTGKLGLYVSAINHQRKKETDNPTIGLLICKTKDNIEVEYSLESSNRPIGISEYQLSKILPDNYKSALPSIEEIEAELKR